MATMKTTAAAMMARAAIDDNGDGTALGNPGDQCEPTRK
jgi:hypothetical protein